MSFYCNNAAWNADVNLYCDTVNYDTSERIPFTIQVQSDITGNFCDKVRLVMCEARRKIAHLFVNPNIENIITQDEFIKLDKEFDRLTSHIKRYEKREAEHTIII